MLGESLGLNATGHHEAAQRAERVNLCHTSSYMTAFVRQLCSLSEVPFPHGLWPNCLAPALTQGGLGCRAS